MKIDKEFVSGLCFFKVPALLSVMFLILIFFFYKPLKSVSYNKDANNIIGSMVDNLNLTGRDDSSYESDFSFKVSTADIFKYIMHYSKYIAVEDAQNLARLIKKECKKYNLNPYLVLAIIKVESGFNPAAISSQGAVGLMQMMPETASHLASEKGLLKEEINLHDPMINVELGIYYFSYLFKRYNNDEESALFAYNYGPGKFEVLAGSVKAVPAYVNKVIQFRNHLENISMTKES